MQSLELNKESPAVFSKQAREVCFTTWAQRRVLMGEVRKLGGIENKACSCILDQFQEPYGFYARKEDLSMVTCSSPTALCEEKLALLCLW